MKTRVLVCCCCGGPAPAFKQWWNRDTGYGICPTCWPVWVQKLGEAEALQCCGQPGIHHSLDEPRPPAPVPADACRLG